MKKKALLFVVFLLFDISSISFATTDTASAYILGPGYERYYSNTHYVVDGVSVNYNLNLYLGLSGSGSVFGRAFFTSDVAYYGYPHYYAILEETITSGFIAPSSSGTIISSGEQFWVDTEVSCTGCSANFAGAVASMNW